MATVNPVRFAAAERRTGTGREKKIADRKIMTIQQSFKAGI